MKWIFAVAVVALLAVSAHANDDEEELIAEEGEARLGFITVNTDGSTSLTFNATSIQNAVILGLFILVLGALLLPLFGLFGGSEESSGYGYGETEQTYGQPSAGYQEPSSGYHTYSKRSVELMGPVLNALSSAYKKYEEDEE